MHDHRPVLRPHRRAHLAGLILAVASACGGAGSGTQPLPPATMPSPAATAPAPTAPTDPVTAYRAYWDAYLAAADPMNPGDGRLDEHATGPALEVLRRSFGELASKNHVIRGELDLAPRLVSSEADVAVVSDCYGDGTGLYDAESGMRLDQPSGRRHLVAATLRRVDGTWKVERLADRGLGCTAS